MPISEIPPVMRAATVAAEDASFFDNPGFDPRAVLRATYQWVRSGTPQSGASTITQQLVKNTLLGPEQTAERKIKEAFLAVWLEFHISKDEILKLYLDRAYMGGGTFGVVAAADYYFGKSVKDLSLAESAMLAGLFKAPTKYAPHINLPAARARASDVLQNMVEAGFLTEGQIQTARRNPATPIDRKRDVTPDFYLDWAFQQVQQVAKEGKLGTDRVLIVKTPLDTSIQKKADETVEDMLRQYGRQYDADQAAMVIMDPDGAVRAMVGGRDYGQSQFNRASDSLRQPGSSFKPYVYAAALTNLPRLRPNTIVTDTGVCIGNWCPGNYNKSYSGSMPLATALAKSINTIPVHMSINIGRAAGINHVANAAKYGRAKIVETARAMGLTTPLTDTVSLPIGAAEVTVIDQAAGYAVFASGGKRAKPYAAVEVRNSSGEVIYRHDTNEKPAEQVLQPRVVADMNFMLNKVVEEGTGKRAALEGIRSAGKTGTTNAYRDAWYVGFTGNLVAAVWFGNDDHTSTNSMTGGTLPAMAWHEVMTFAHQNVEIRPIPYLGPEGSQMVAGAKNGAPSGRLEVVTTGSVPGALSRRSFEVIGGIGELFRNVDRAGGPRAALTPPERALADNGPVGVRPAARRTALP